MNKKIISLFLFIFAVFVFFQLKSSTTNTTANLEVSQLVASSVNISKAPIDKIEVVHFHGTNQCVSCIRVGEFALKTIQEKFPDEYASGKIIFKEINGELPENKTIVIRYQARGSSLFINTIRGEKDSITEDTKVWRLISNEKQYIDYFEEKLKTLLRQ